LFLLLLLSLLARTAARGRSGKCQATDQHQSVVHRNTSSEFFPAGKARRERSVILDIGRAAQFPAYALPVYMEIPGKPLAGDIAQGPTTVSESEP